MGTFGNLKVDCMYDTRRVVCSFYSTNTGQKYSNKNCHQSRKTVDDSFLYLNGNISYNTVLLASIVSAQWLLISIKFSSIALSSSYT